MNAERNIKIMRADADLRAAGYWTRIYRLHFPQQQYPIARIDYGVILSNGERERAIGTASVWQDGHVSRSHHL